MGAIMQSTVRTEIVWKGLGLHTGGHCTVTVKPAGVDAGISFVSTSDPDLIIEARPDFVSATNHGTTLSSGHVSVATVEHLMAAFALCGVDNARVELDGREIPIMDGSAANFVDAILAAGLKDQPAQRDEIVIDEPITVVDGDRHITIEPADAFSMDVSIAFEDCLIGRQSLSLHLDDPLNLDRLAKSRTFCRLYEVEYLRDVGLIRGGSLENSIVVDGDRLLNDGLRDPQEFVLHKALDLIGDLYLVGRPIRGAVRAEKPGHDLNTRIAHAVWRRYVGEGVSAPELMAAAG